MKRISANDAKSSLPALIRDAERGEVVLLTRGGKAAVVLISASEYLRIAERHKQVDRWECAIPGSRGQSR